MYGFLADVLVFVHVLYVGYVVVGQLAIILAAACRWEWGRNRWFRLTHLLAIGIVAVEAVMGWRCPLTTWEEQLRVLGGQAVSGETFLGRLLHNLLFVDQYFTDGRPPEGFFTTLYLATLFIVLQGLAMYPPRLLGKRRDAGLPLAAA